MGFCCLVCSVLPCSHHSTIALNSSITTTCRMRPAQTGMHIVSSMFKFDFVCDSGLDWLQATKGSFSFHEIQITEWHSEVKKWSHFIYAISVFFSVLLYLIDCHVFLYLAFFFLPYVCIPISPFILPSIAVSNPGFRLRIIFWRNLLLMSFRIFFCYNLWTLVQSVSRTGALFEVSSEVYSHFSANKLSKSDRSYE